MFLFATLYDNETQISIRYNIQIQNLCMISIYLYYDVQTLDRNSCISLLLHPSP